MNALRHGMVGQPGLGVFGPWEDGEAVKAAIVEAGKEFGLRLVGARAYSSIHSNQDGFPLPYLQFTAGRNEDVPAMLSGEQLEAIASFGGNFYSNNISDYYLNPWDLGYGPIVKFDHDFIGREALEKMAKQPQRKKSNARAG